MLFTRPWYGCTAQVTLNQFHAGDYQELSDTFEKLVVEKKWKIVNELML